jgi:hypothetical protein
MNFPEVTRAAFFSSISLFKKNKREINEMISLSMIGLI